MLAWLSSQSDEVKVGALVLLGVFVSAVGGAVSGFVTAIGTVVNGAWSRRHERTLKLREKVLDQRMSGAELLLEKITGFDRAAFSSFKRLIGINDSLIKGLTENPPERASRIETNSGEVVLIEREGDDRRYPESFIDMQRELAQLSAALKAEHDEVTDWLRYDAPRYWAWLSKPTPTSRIVLALAERYDAHYTFLRAETDALLKLYKGAPRLFEEDMNKGANREKRDAFIAELRVRSDRLYASQTRKELSEKVAVLQKRLVKFVT